eukprot:g1881.t1
MREEPTELDLLESSFLCPVCEEEALLAMLVHSVALKWAETSIFALSQNFIGIFVARLSIIKYLTILLALTVQARIILPEEFLSFKLKYDYLEYSAL